MMKLLVGLGFRPTATPQLKPLATIKASPPPPPEPKKADTGGNGSTPVKVSPNSNGAHSPSKAAPAPVVVNGSRGVAPEVSASVVNTADLHISLLRMKTGTFEGIDISNLSARDAAVLYNLLERIEPMARELKAKISSRHPSIQKMVEKGGELISRQ